MKLYRYFAVFLGVACVAASLGSWANVPGSSIPSPTVKAFDQKDIPPASQKEKDLATARKAIEFKRNEIIDKLTKIDIVYMNEKDPAKKAALSKQRNAYRADLLRYEAQMGVMLKKLSAMVTERVAVANPSSVSADVVKQIQLLKRQMSIATERSTARAKLGKTTGDPEFTMMSERFKTYTALLGTKMARLTPSESKMLASMSDKNKKTAKNK